MEARKARPDLPRAFLFGRRFYRKEPEKEGAKEWTGQVKKEHIREGTKGSGKLICEQWLMEARNPRP